jgi:hypothetical protein
MSESFEIALVKAFEAVLGKVIDYFTKTRTARIIASAKSSQVGAVGEEEVEKSS